MMDAVTQEGGSHFTPSITPHLKMCYLAGLSSRTTTYAELSMDPILPSETGVPAPPNDRPHMNFLRRIAEGVVQLVTEFLESCASSDSLPYQATETLRRISYFRSLGVVHVTHQVRLAKVIEDTFANPVCAEIRSAVINHQMFMPYADTSKPWDWRQKTFLNDKTARDKIKQTFSEYADHLASDSALDSTADLDRVRAIVRGFESYHLIDSTGTWKTLICWRA
jgi:hypothetical protein